jgi:hypothetical protein
MKTLISVLTAAAMTILTAGYPSTASAAWWVNGILVSNMCRAPSGAWWVYPPPAAQPVGSPCAIYSTGESGVVTAN